MRCSIWWSPIDTSAGDVMVIIVGLWIQAGSLPTSSDGTIRREPKLLPPSWFCRVLVDALQRFVATSNAHRPLTRAPRLRSSTSSTRPKSPLPLQPRHKRSRRISTTISSLRRRDDWTRTRQAELFAVQANTSPFIASDFPGSTCLEATLAASLDFFATAAHSSRVKSR